MTDISSLLFLLGIATLSFVLNAIYKWVTAKNSQYSYPVRFRPAVASLPWVALVIFPVFMLNYFISMLSETIGLVLIFTCLLMPVLELFAIIIALFHRQSRERVTKPFQNKYVQSVLVKY